VFLNAVADQTAVSVENAGCSPQFKAKQPSKSARGSPANCTTPSPRLFTA
jgi:hypothetical protein